MHSMADIITPAIEQLKTDLTVSNALITRLTQEIAVEMKILTDERSEHASWKTLKLAHIVKMKKYMHDGFKCNISQGDKYSKLQADCVALRKNLVGVPVSGGGGVACLSRFGVTGREELEYLGEESRIFFLNWILFVS